MMTTSHALEDKYSAEEDAKKKRLVVARLTLGEADLGIVYATDVAAEPRITAAWNEPPACPCITYPAAAITDRGSEFLEFLETTTAQGVLAAHGFAPEPAPSGSQ